MNKNSQYFFLDLNMLTMKVTGWGISPTATLTGDTPTKNVHRIFLTKGQYHKLLPNLKLV